MISSIARKILSPRVYNRLLTSTPVYRLRNGVPQRMTAGIGRGLLFDPGPSNRAYASGNNELPVQQALASCLKTGGVLYDIGANVGFFTVLGAKLVGPKGSVRSFEPVPQNAAYVRLNARLNGFGNVSVIEAAVSSDTGEASFWTAAYSGGGALESATAPPDATDLIKVHAISIDDAIFLRKWTPPTVVKVDVEGAELEVLRGMTRTLSDVKPAIIFEIDDGELPAFEDKYNACEEFLQAAGYRVERLEDSYPGETWLVGHGLAIPPG